MGAFLGGLYGACSILVALDVRGVPLCWPECPRDTECTSYGECVPARVPEPAPVAPTGLVSLDSAFHARSVAGETQTVVALVPRATFVDRKVTFEPEFPLLYVLTSGPDGGLLAGNATASVKYHWFDARTEVFGGGGLTLPMASTEANGNGGAYLVGAGARGLWNVWWYYPDVMGFFVPVGFRRVEPSRLDWGVEAATGLLLPLRLESDQRPLGILQGALHLGYATPDFETGLILREVRIPGNGAKDPFQASAEPYARFFFGPAFVGGGVVLNIDEPLGPIYDRNAVWGVRIEVGARL